MNLDETDLRHAFKLIVTVWEIVESLIRALVYLRLGTTYERSQKLISVFSRFVLSEDERRKVLPLIHKLYYRRTQVVHKATIAEKNMAESTLRLFCELASELVRVLSRYIDTRELEERVRIVCEHFFRTSG